MGAFVKSPFKKYKNSKEKLDKHELTEYHKKVQERGLCIRSQLENLFNRIDVQLHDVAKKNKETNQAILPHIVDMVRLCTTQQIPLRDHRDHKIQFAEAPTCNEGNFIAIVRLLAKSNPDLKKHLELGPQNARYTSKTIQNEIIGVMANLIRDNFRECLAKCPHFANC